MTEIVNLRRARKAKLRAGKDEAAAASRAAHGTPKALRKLEAARKEQAAARLCGHELEKPSDDN
jgi:hypothetical protein